MPIQIPTPRLWSNAELRKTLKHLPDAKRVINVSGWKDKDKEGGFYKEYFAPTAEYVISNYEEDSARGGTDSAIGLDLGVEISPDLVGAFDVAFSHTVLEHVIDPVFAFQQIAKLSSDIVITIVPFKQKLHFEQGQYGDYYRMTPFSMRRMHEINGLTILYESFTPRPSMDVYLYYIGTKHPENHPSFPRHLPPIEELNFRVGGFTASDLARNVVSRFYEKFLTRPTDGLG